MSPKNINGDKIDRKNVKGVVPGQKFLTLLETLHGLARAITFEILKGWNGTQKKQKYGGGGSAKS